MKGGKDMFYAKYMDQNGQEQNWIYYSWSEYHKDTFSPECRPLNIVEFTAHGKTYAERKDSVREIAMDFQNAEPELSYGEWSTVSEWFERMGKRYGLMREFRENCIV